MTSKKPSKYVVFLFFLKITFCQHLWRFEKPKCTDRSVIVTESRPHTSNSLGPYLRALIIIKYLKLQRQ